MTANDLMRRLRASEISYSEFFKESEKLSLEELQSLTSLLIEWTNLRPHREVISQRRIKRLHRRSFHPPLVKFPTLQPVPPVPIMQTLTGANPPGISHQPDPA